MALSDIRIKTTYVTSDGEEFYTYENAVKHQNEIDNHKFEMNVKEAIESALRPLREIIEAYVKENHKND